MPAIVRLSLPLSIKSNGMKLLFQSLGTMGILLLLGCGSKTQDPTPITPPGGGNNGGTETGYSQKPTQAVNTRDAAIYYNATSKKVTGTGSIRPGGFGVQTTDGGKVVVELIGLTADNAVIKNLSDAITVEFTKSADPILEYIVTDEAAKTIIKYDVHFNKGSVAAYLTIQGNTVDAFKGQVITWQDVITLSKSPSQLIQSLKMD